VFTVFENGGVGVVELLYRSNILALVGGGGCPQWPVNKVMLWDDTKRKCVGELSFHTPVKSVRMRKDIIIVALEKFIYIYNFVDLQLKYSFETMSNPRGLLALSVESLKRVVAFPCIKQKGLIQLELLGSSKTVIIPAHESELGALCVNREGTLVASASERGTVIRVFSTASGQVCHELRRGADRAIIFSICFNAASTFLACTSDKCTVHVFQVFDQPAVDGEEGDAIEAVSYTERLFQVAGSAQSLITGSLGEYLPKYFSTETRRSVVRFPVVDAWTVCAFGAKPNTILVAGLDGSFASYGFDLKTGAHERIFLGSVYESIGHT